MKIYSKSLLDKGYSKEQINALSLIGILVRKNYEDIPDGVDPDAWRVGYGNAISDIIKEFWPDEPGAQRITLEELKAEDLRRQHEPL